MFIGTCTLYIYTLAARVSSKLEDGDFRGAVRLASSRETFCVPDETSLDALRKKHPPSHPDTSLPHSCPPVSPGLVISSTSVLKAVCSFPSGSAGGQDGLLPQHLKDLLCPSLGLGSSNLLTSLTNFTNMVIAGGVPVPARPYFFGAKLIGLNKDDGGIRPIAVGCTLRRLVAKCVCAEVKEEMGSFLYPRQLGFGVPLGAESAVHAARSYVYGLDESNFLVKLDFQNAFNSIRRDLMLANTLEKAPAIYPLAFSAYCQPSLLFFDKFTISSCEGVQQGDPLGPLLFCIALHDLICSLKSELVAFYLDDGSIGGSLDDVSADLHYLESNAHHLGLTLNQSKSGFICSDNLLREEFVTLFPSIREISGHEATLLGSPIGSIESINFILAKKISNLRTLGERLKLLNTHDALCLLRNAFSLPKLMYTLRTSPCFQSTLLTTFDELQRSLLESICNIKLSDLSWKQASLPISGGGIGIRSAVMLAPSAFLASASGCTSISLAILPERLHSQVIPFRSDALCSWKSACPPQSSIAPPVEAQASKQKFWDSPIVDGCFKALLSSSDAGTRVRLLASRQKEASAWLTAPPVSALGLRMGNETIRVAIGLRLGTPLCVPHTCPLCGMHVDESGVHGLSCRRSKGRIPRHAALNDIILRALSSANMPSILEPQGLCRLDGKRPDGITVTPWAKGRALVWDVTCWDSYAPSNITMASSAAGSVANLAASKKRNLYNELSINHHFQPIAFESTGAFGSDTLDFIHDLAKRARLISSDPLSYLKLCQQISVCIQNFNAVSVLGCCSV